MDFSYTEEQQALGDVLMRFIAKDYGFAQRQVIVRTEPGYSREVWSNFVELGLLALPLPEDYGGLGGSATDVAMVMDAIGRGLLPEPYLATVVLAGGLIRDTGTEAQKVALLPAIAEGRLLMTLAHYEPRGRYRLAHVATTAVPNGAGWKISGAKTAAIGAPFADKLLVSARTAGDTRDENGISLFLVDKAAQGLAISGYPTQDGGRSADLRLDVQVNVDALLGTLGAAYPVIEKAIDAAGVALCAEAIGIMSALNAITVDYLNVRKQFGVPLARFQALQHRMADMFLACEQARSLTYLATDRLGRGDDDERRRTAAAARSLIARAARLVSQDAIQLHGGIGMTDELIVGHYVKRLTMINATFGDADHHLDRFGELMREACP